MEELSKVTASDSVVGLIAEELRRIKMSDGTLSSELLPFNIVPLDAPSLTNVVGTFPEVRAAVSALRYTEYLPKLPADFEVSGLHNSDIFDLLERVFGFQKDNIRNREKVVLSLANAQYRFQAHAEAEPQDRGPPLPKFGDWDVNNPASAEGFTVIFNKARDEKKTSTTTATNNVVSPRRDNDAHNKQNDYPGKWKWFCCG